MQQRSAILNFPTIVDQPYISRVIRNFDVEVNILQASITPEEDGRLFAIFSGTRSALDQALQYLRDNDVRVVLPAKNLVWDEERCVSCTACVGQCPSAAFTIDPQTQYVVFHEEQCIACELCIPACTFAAIESIGDHLKKTGAL